MIPEEKPGGTYGKTKGAAAAAAAVQAATLPAVTTETPTAQTAAAPTQAAPVGATQLTGTQIAAALAAGAPAATAPAAGTAVTTDDVLRMLATILSQRQPPLLGAEALKAIVDYQIIRGALPHD